MSINIMQANFINKFNTHGKLSWQHYLCQYLVSYLLFTTDPKLGEPRKVVIGWQLA